MYLYINPNKTEKRKTWIFEHCKSAILLWGFFYIKIQSLVLLQDEFQAVSLS